MLLLSKGIVKYIDNLLISSLSNDQIPVMRLVFMGLILFLNCLYSLSLLDVLIAGVSTGHPVGQFLFVLSAEISLGILVAIQQ